MNKFLCILLTGLISLPGSLSAQGMAVRFDRLGPEDGLSQSTISAICQDHYGFIWVGTRNGLNMFDGYQFTVYKSDPNSSNALSDNWITAICEDQKKNFWIGTINKGLNLFDRVSGVFYHVTDDSTSPVQLTDNSIIAMWPDKESVWVATRKAVEKVSVTMRDDRPSFRSEVLFEKSSILTVFVDRSGTIWTGSKEGLDSWAAGRSIHFGHQRNNPRSLSHNTVNAIAEDSSGNLWVATDAGLDRLDKTTGQFDHYNLTVPGNPVLSDSRVMSLYSDRNGILWIGTNIGLYKMTSPGSFLAYRHSQIDPYSLSNNEVRSLFEDRSRILWIGTFGGGGLNKLDLKRQKFLHYRHEEDNPQSLTNDVVRGFLEARDGTVWVGTHDGLNHFYPQSGEFKWYEYKKADPSGLSHPEARTMVEDPQGFIWVGTEGGGLNRVDPKSDRFVHFKNDRQDRSSLGQNEVSSLVLTQSGMLWIGTFGQGIDRLNINESIASFVHYRHNPDDDHSLSSDQISTLFLSKKSVLWAGTFGGGLNRIELDEQGLPLPGGMIVFRNDPNDSRSISSDVIFSVAEDDSGEIWVGTSAGLCRMIQDNGQSAFVRYAERDGLPDNYVYGILPDRKGQLWITTVQGLSCFKVDRVAPPFEKKGEFRTYDVKDGLQGNEFKFGAFHRGASGRMYIGGTNGFNIFEPEEIEDNRHIPPIVLTKFKIYNSEDLSWLEPGKSSVIYKDLLQLKYNEDFSFEFSSLDFTNPEKNQYAYYMEGFDKTWIESGTRRFVNYTNLDHGQYTFRVRGSNNDGVWNMKGAAIKLVIVPPFWKTWWFRLATVLALALIAFTWFRVHIHNIEQSNRRLEKEVAERTKEIQNQRDNLKVINEKLEATLKTLHSTQSQLLHAEKMSSLGQMVAGIAHEINNPLTFVDGNLHILEEHILKWDQMVAEYGNLIESGDLEKIREGLKTVQENHEYEYLRRDTSSILESCRKGSQRIKSVVQELQKFSRIDTTALEPYDVHEGINIALTMLKPQYIDRIEIVRTFGQLPFIEAAPGLISQVFLNILANAIEAIPARGQIEISTTRRKDKVEVAIRDNGKGMTKSMLKSVFDPFFTTKDIGRGVGLGLSVSYGIVKKHHGDIEVESEEGAGSVFRILLPIKGKG